MKKFFIPILLVSSFVLPFVSAINPSVIIVALSIAYIAEAYLEYLKSQRAHVDEMQEMKNYVDVLNKKYLATIENYDRKFEAMESEMGKVSLSVSRVPGAVGKKDKPSVLF